MKRSSGREKMSNKTNKKTSSVKFENFSYPNSSVPACRANNKIITLCPHPAANVLGFRRVIRIILLFIILLININASMWIAKLETINCACSDNFMRNYIKYFLFVMIPVVIIQLFIDIYWYYNNIIGYISTIWFMDPIDILKYIFGIFHIINICIAIIYINRLKELNCECSEDIRREVYWIYNIILASIFCILILIFIYFFLYKF